MWTHVAIIALDSDGKLNGGKIDEKDLLGILKNLTEEDAFIREQAVLALGALEKKADKYAADICNMLKKEKEGSVKEAAAKAFMFMGNKGSRVIKCLIDITQDADPEHFQAVLTACNALAVLGTDTPGMIKVMEKIVEKEGLNRFQKDMIRKAIETLKNPPKPVKEQPKIPRNDIKVGPDPR